MKAPLDLAGAVGDAHAVSANSNPAWANCQCQVGQLRPESSCFEYGAAPHLVPRGCRTEIRQVLGFRSLNTKRMNEQKMFLQLYRVYEVAGVHRTG